MIMMANNQHPPFELTSEGNDNSRNTNSNWLQNNETPFIINTQEDEFASKGLTHI